MTDTTTETPDPAPDLVFSHTDEHGDQLTITAWDAGRLIIDTSDEDGDGHAVFVEPQAIVDALAAYLERDQAHVEIGGVTMTQTQYDAAVADHVRRTAAEEGPSSDYLRILQRRVFENSRDHGFYDDAPQEEGPANDAYLSMKLMLIVGEVAEAHEELRKGKRPTESYFLDGAGETPLPAFLADAEARGARLKPEGFPSELADVVIRVLDLAEACEIDLAAVIEEKHAYNRSRPVKHGKRF